ncbi:unnamed protein product [Brachionus calyciflorus]|uniref:Archaemetzincin-2 n=1 Tax=Brachionus calyciflorus TaxID=104777 RepID=A0A813MJY5_9BILA|nr:unnamed protein product [Brachionus calyciflorus]
MDFVSTELECQVACGFQINSKNEQCFFQKDLNLYKWKKTNIPDMKWFVNLNNFYQYLPKPLDDEWLNYNKENGQTFKNYIRLVKKSKNLQNPLIKSKIFLMPLKIDENIFSKFILNGLAEFVQIYFDIDVIVEDDKNLNSKFDKSDLIDGIKALSILKTFKKKNSFSTVAITTCDLVHQDSFVFGLSDQELQVCIVSLYRYVQHLIDNRNFTEKELLKKVSSVICHEIGHTFGLEHCIYYRCIMNGSNTLEEDDKLPIYLCPVCLRKLHFLLNFDIEKRYLNLMEYCEKYEFKGEYNWYQNRLDNSKILNK